MKEGTREDRIIARRHRGTLRGEHSRTNEKDIGRHRRGTYEGTGRRPEKTQEHMVIQKDIKEDTEEHLGMHRRL